MPTIYKPKKKSDNSYTRKERMAVYNTVRWKRLRLVKLRNNPLCEICEKKGITKTADDVHHIQSFMSVDDPETRKALAFDYDNLMSLCDECHSEIHKRKRSRG